MKKNVLKNRSDLIKKISESRSQRAAFRKDEGYPYVHPSVARVQVWPFLPRNTCHMGRTWEDKRLHWTAGGQRRGFPFNSVNTEEPCSTRLLPKGCHAGRSRATHTCPVSTHCYVLLLARCCVNPGSTLNAPSRVRPVCTRFFSDLAYSWATCTLLWRRLRRRCNRTPRLLPNGWHTGEFFGLQNIVFMMMW